MKVCTTYIGDIVPGAEEKPSNKINIILSIKENYSPVGNYDYNLGFEVYYDIEDLCMLSASEGDRISPAEGVNERLLQHKLDLERCSKVP